MFEENIKCLTVIVMKDKFTLNFVFALLRFRASAPLISLCLYAGVGGGVEGKEKVDIIPLVKWTLVFLAGLGTVFGVGIAMAAKRFAVQIDPRVEKVKDQLAHAHCGACGYAGCEQYAEAVVNKPEVAPNLCIPAGAKAR